MVSFAGIWQRCGLVVVLAGLAGWACGAEAQRVEVGAAAAGGPAVGVSSSLEDSVLNGEDAPLPALRAAAFRGQAESSVVGGTRPFSALGVQLKVGTGGVGFDLATPLNSRLNLRAGASFFSDNPQINTDGLIVNGGLVLRTVAASVDFFPFRGSFRISPGITMYNNTHISATAGVPGGQSVDFNDVTYTSSTTDPIHGTANLQFGNKVAPRLTVGFGNMIPRGNKHLSFPFEIGFQYIAQPVVTLNLSGTACDQSGNCQPIATDAMTQANIKAEQQDLTNDLSPLRFYPIVSFGVSYKFGR